MGYINNALAFLAMSAKNVAITTEWLEGGGGISPSVLENIVGYCVVQTVGILCL